MENFNPTIAFLQEKLKEYQKQHSFQQAPRELYEPVNYILQIGGKKTRPLLVLLGHFLFDERVDKSLPAAMAVEIFHNFTLLHDDIMDAAPLRRGKPTVHTLYGQNTAILSGDVMLIYAYEYLAKACSSENLFEVLRIFNTVAVKVCEGQQEDMNFESRPDVTIPEYLQMIEDKTSVLLAGALQIGGMLGGATVEDARHLYEFGRNIGLAFQVQDDYLDAFGDPKIFGKKPGGDIVQNKKTYLYLKALEVAEPDTRAALKKWFAQTGGDEQAKIEAVIAIFQKLGIPALTNETKMEYQRAAFSHLEAIQVDEARKKVLSDLANELLIREN